MHGHELTIEEAEKFLGLVEFINVAVDPYHPEVGRELMSYLAKVAAYSYDAATALEVIRRLKVVADSFHDSWSKEDVELISDTAYALMDKFAQKAKLRNSTVSQSAIALLKDLSMYKELKKKKLTSHPRNLLARLKAKDEPDVGPPIARGRKRMRQDDEEGGDERYIEMMDQLTETDSTESALQLEAQLEEMGYEPNVL